MLRYIVAVIITLKALTICALEGVEKSTPYGPSLPPYFKIEQHCANETQKGNVIGSAVAVVENGNVSFIKTFGRLKKGDSAPVNDNTVFQIGSTSKPIAATLFAIAQQQKRITLNTPITIATKNKAAVEMRHVLSHTSGFKRTGWNWQVEHGTTRKELINLFGKKEQNSPGHTFDYHNVAFSLIEEPLEKAFNTPFNNAMGNYLFKPLGMSRTTIGMAQFKQQSNRAWPHERGKNGGFIPSDAFSYRYHDAVQSAAGVNASIKDMVNFLMLHLGKFPDVATREQLSFLYQPITQAPDADRWLKDRIKGDFSSHYGYGFRILKRADDTIVYHGGWLKGISSFIGFSSKTGRGIVILSNTESTFAMFTAIDFFEGKF